MTESSNTNDITASFPAEGARIVEMDAAETVVGNRPVLGFVLTRAGKVWPVTADGIWDRDGFFAVLHPSGEVAWSGEPIYPSLDAFKAELTRRREARRLGFLKIGRKLTAVSDEETPS